MWSSGVGGASRDRTGDLYNAIVALSQLSYGPVEEGLDGTVAMARVSNDQRSIGDFGVNRAGSALRTSRLPLVGFQAMP